MATTPTSSTRTSAATLVPSARQILVNWANQQDSWVRGIVVDVLVQGQDLNQAQLSRHFDRLLIEKQLGQGEAAPLPPISWEGAGSTETAVLRLVKLKHLRGVNALIDDQEIAFNPHLTLCYGENAAGKTGYVRILKRVASVKATEEVLPDVYAVTPVSPTATISYELAEAPGDYAWNGACGVEPFTGLAIFDARAVQIHVDEDLTYRYTPSDLALFKYVHNAIEAIKELLDRQRQQTQPRGNPFLMKFQRGTSVYPLVEALGASTDLSKVTAATSMTEEDEAELASLRTQVPVLRSTVGRDQAALAVSQRDLLRNIYGVGQRLANFDFASYDAARGRLAAAQTAHEQAASQLFVGLASEIRDSLEWRNLIEAGDAYIKHLEGPDYPHDGDACIYCRQPLAADAAALVQNYRTYLNNALVREIQDAQKAVATVLRPSRR